MTRGLRCGYHHQSHRHHYLFIVIVPVISRDGYGPLYPFIFHASLQRFASALPCWSKRWNWIVLPFFLTLLAVVVQPSLPGTQGL